MGEIYGFYENEYPEYSDKFECELQSVVAADEVNNLVTKIRNLERGNGAALRQIVELEQELAVLKVTLAQAKGEPEPEVKCTQNRFICEYAAHCNYLGHHGQNTESKRHRCKLCGWAFEAHASE